MLEFFIKYLKDKYMLGLKRVNYFSLQFSLSQGCKDKEHGALLKELMQTSNFRVTVVEESDVVEICGALKVPTQPLRDSAWPRLT